MRTENKKKNTEEYNDNDIRSTIAKVKMKILVRMNKCFTIVLEVMFNIE